MSENEVISVLAQRENLFRPQIEVLLKDHLEVPTLVQSSTILEFQKLQDGTPVTAPVFCASLELNPYAKRLPATHQRLLEETFGARSALNADFGAS